MFHYFFYWKHFIPGELKMFVFYLAENIFIFLSCKHIFITGHRGVCCNPCNWDGRYWMPTMVGDPQGPMLVKFEICLNPPLELPISDFMSASMLFNSICIKDMIGSCRPGFNPRYRQNFSVGILQDLSTLEDFNLIVSMVKSDLMDIYYYGQQLWVKVQVGFGTLVYMQSSC